MESLPPASESLRMISKWIHDIALRDRDSFEKLFLACQKGIWASAYTTLRDAHAAEDVLQDTMLYVWNHAGDYQRDGNPIAWLHTIARHRALDMVKKNRRLIYDETLLEIEAADRAMPLLSDESDLTFRMAMDRLKPEDAQVFTLKVVAGLSHYEISRLLNISYYKTYYKYQRAVRALRAIFADSME